MLDEIPVRGKKSAAAAHQSQRRYNVARERTGSPGNDMESAILTRNLTKVFKPSQGWLRFTDVAPTSAVRGVDLEVPRGELFGLLGPNGAGKTTLTKMLCTLIAPSEGEAFVAGHPIQEAEAVKRKVGLVVTDERSFYWRLSGRRNLLFFAALHRLFGAEAEQRVDAALEAVDLHKVGDRWFDKYSTGMKQRLAIARSLLHRPEILFLDEPSRSLDPTATQRLHSLITDLVNEQKLTVFLITHDLVEAEKLCDRVAVMFRGQVQAIGEPAGLRQQLQPRIAYLVTLDRSPAAHLDSLQRLVPGLAPAGETGLTFKIGEKDRLMDEFLRELQRLNLHVLNIQGTPPSLEDVFAHFTVPDDQPEEQN
ncbi:MAG: ABC transporter ATP-binding protein [Anaerolineales bacterium]|nr:ABC transporter ATP-binding protein [Anaerolineales bacterium]